MKPKLLFLIFMLSSVITFSQTNSDKIHYRADAIYMSVRDENNKEISNIPMGKNVGMELDTFYKSYEITFFMDGGLGDIKLSFLQKRLDGSIKMTDKDNMIYYVNDSLYSNGTLKILREKKVNGLYSCFVITNATKSEY